jgi:DNA-binding LacI/PurR family transcriptional regulator
MRRLDPPHRARLVDVAQRAGCSSAAVSCVLTGSGAGQIRVGPQKAELIRRAAADLNFRPNHAAQQLKGKQSLVLGILSRNWETTFQLRTFYWLQQAAAAQGYHILAAQCRSAAEVAATADEFLARGIDGAMCFGHDTDAPDAECCAALARFPHLVSLFGRVDVSGSVCLRVCEASGIAQAVEHLHQSGRRRMTLIVLPEGPGMEQRRKGFLAAHRRLGLKVRAEQIQTVEMFDWIWQQADLAERVDAWIERVVLGGGADAVIAQDDFRAAFLIQGLARRGLRVPQDVAVIGYENDLISHHLTPPLSTVHIPVREVAVAAVQMLVAAAASPSAAALKSKTFKPRLMVRGSG